jgi:hypothetical protein
LKTVTIGTVERQAYESGNVTAINLTAHLVHASNNVAFSGNPIDWSQVILTVEITKADGRKHTICQDPVLPLALATSFTNGMYRQTSTVGTPEQVIYQVQTAGLPNILKQCAKIQFPCVVNIEKGDKMRVEVNATSGCVNTTLVNTSTSTINFDIEEGIGNSFSLPKFTVEVAKATEQTMMVAGTGVVACHFINNDKSGITSTNQVVQTTSISCGLLDRVELYDELIQRRYREFPSSSEADLRHQSFVLFSSEDEKQTKMQVRADQFKLVVSLTAANITANKNWVVLQRLVNDEGVLVAGANREIKHMERNKAQFIN